MKEINKNYIKWGFLAAIVLVFLITLFSTYSFFFCRIDVPPGKMVIVIQKTGSPPPGVEGEQVLVPRGWRGIWEEPLGPGRHYLYPYAGMIFYSFETYAIPQIPVGKIGVVTSRGGKPLPPDRILANADEKGTWRQVLGPGWHLLNPRGYDIDIIVETVIEPGYVGVLTAQEGVLPPSDRLSNEGERGVRAATLPPGRYYINPREFQVEIMEVGYRQIMVGPISAGEADVHVDEPVEFNSLDGFKFTTTVSVLLLYKPEDSPKVVRRYGGVVPGQEAISIENKIVIPQILTKIKEEGQKFQGREMITGTQREIFQKRFTDSLQTVCDPNGVHLVFSYVRRIDTEDRLKDPIRKAKLADLRKETIEQQRETSETETQLNISSQMIDQATQQTGAEYAAQASVIDASTEYQGRQIEAETALRVSELRKQTAAILGEQKVVLGTAEADSVRYIETAKADGQKLGVKAFGGDAEAYRIFGLSKALDPSLSIIIRETGPGTLWTDIDLQSRSPADMRALKELSEREEK
ncbi:MAG: SPFH domain-containing protein [Candidatus Omnitrophota bacterium]